MVHFEWSGLFARPITAGLLVVGVVTLLGSVYGEFFKKKPPATETPSN